MSNFRQQLFHQYASKGLATSIEAFKAKYQPKKENRFHHDGVTYEIGPARLNEDSITFEISSKIPQDELESREEFEDYFVSIKKVVEDDAKRPEDIDMDNIVQELGMEETKERDYVRLVYRYGFEEMVDDAAVAQTMAQLRKDPRARVLPEISNVNTMAGRVVLLCVEDFMQAEAMVRMERLIEANQGVRQQFAKQGRKTKKVS